MRWRLRLRTAKVARWTKGTLLLSGQAWHKGCACSAQKPEARFGLEGGFLSALASAFFCCRALYSGILFGERAGLWRHARRNRGLRLDLVPQDEPPGMLGAGMENGAFNVPGGHCGRALERSSRK